MAIINIGSGSVKLYLEQSKTLFSKVTLLASYVNNNDTAALNNTFDAVSSFFSLAKEAGEDVCIFGTESMRRIDSTLSNMIFKSLGLKVDIISGETEALCGFLGCLDDSSNNSFLSTLASKSTQCPNSPSTNAAILNSVSSDAFIYSDNAKNKRSGNNSRNMKVQPKSHEGNDMVVIDVGGASSEVSVGQNFPHFAISLPLGSVSLFDHFKIDVLANPEIFMTELFNHIDNIISTLPLAKFSNVRIIKLIGGGVINLATALFYQTFLDIDKMEIDFNILPSFINKIFKMSIKERITVYPFLEEKRAMVLPYGVSIIYRLLKLLPKVRAEVSKCGLIEGYINLRKNR